MKTTIFPAAVKLGDRCPIEWQVPAACRKHSAGRWPGRGGADDDVPAASRHRRVGVCAKAALVAVTIAVAVAVLRPALAVGSPRPRCTIVGTAGSDDLRGSAGVDVICGRGGDDRIRAGRGSDVVRGGGGGDRLLGGRGADRLAGGAGRDRLNGGRGDDVLDGGRGRDRAFGLFGRDALRGGAGRDRLTVRDDAPYDGIDGGPGRDLCIADAGDHRTGCRHPLVASHTRAVPILMYHVINAAGPSTPNPGLYVSGHTFAAQMRLLHRRRYRAVTLQEVYDYWHGAPLPSRPIVVSFDDGFASHSKTAMPILDRYGWRGTLNLALSHYAQHGWGLSRHAVQRLINHGWELDSHTMTHAFLPGLPAGRLAYEVARSRSLLRRAFHVPVSFFCYPYGAYDARVIAAVRRAGYLGASSTEDGLARPSDLYALDRIRVSHGDGVSGLAAHLAAFGLPH